MSSGTCQRRWGFRPRQAWRHAWGWSQETAAAMYNTHHDRTGRTAMTGVRISGYERWHDGGERPTPRTLAALFETSLDQLIDAEDLAAMPDHDRQILLQGTGSGDTGETVPQAPDQPDAAYGGWDEPDINLADQHEVVVMAAHEGSEHAESAERRDIGEATLEQLRADVVRMSHEHMTGDPFPTFREMRRVRRRMYAALDRKLWPRDQTELYFMLAVLNGLMALSANNLGNRQAAEELIRAGWAYATAIDHHPLMAHLRLQHASIAYWHRPRQSRDIARSGLDYLSDGANAAQLHLHLGQAAARSLMRPGLRCVGTARGTTRSAVAAPRSRWPRRTGC